MFIIDHRKWKGAAARQRFWQPIYRSFRRILNAGGHRAITQCNPRWLQSRSATLPVRGGYKWILRLENTDKRVHGRRRAAAICSSLEANWRGAVRTEQPTWHAGALWKRYLPPRCQIWRVLAKRGSCFPARPRWLCRCATYRTGGNIPSKPVDWTWDWQISGFSRI